MIKKDLSINGKFYVCPIYNELIADNKKIRVFDVKKVWKFGSPKELDVFLKKAD